MISTVHQLTLWKNKRIRKKKKVHFTQRKRDDLNEDMDADAELDWGLKQEGNFIGDHWPLVGCSFSRHGKLLLAPAL